MYAASLSRRGVRVWRQWSTRTHAGSEGPHRTPGRHIHWRVARHRHRLLRAGGVAALLAVVGPGLLAGLSDDDPAGITTYSILGANYGYELLWVLALSTAALIVFHEVGVRLGVVTGKGLLTLVRERFGQRAAVLVAGGAGDRQHRHALRRVRRGRGGDGAARAGSAATSACRWRRSASPLLVLRENFRRVEHVLLALSSVFVAYVVAGILAHPDWGAAAQGPGRPEHPAQPRRAAGRGGDGRDDAGALGPRLHPVLRGRQEAAASRTCATSGSTSIVGAVLTGVIGLLRRRRLRRDPARAGHRRQRRQRRGPGAGAAGRQRRRDPLRPRLPRRGAAGGGDRPPLHRLLDLRDARPARRPRRQLRRGAHLLPQLRRRRRRRRRARADPRRAADPDPLPHPGAERGPAAGAAAVHALARPRTAS